MEPSTGLREAHVFWTENSYQLVPFMLDWLRPLYKHGLVSNAANCAGDGECFLVPEELMAEFEEGATMHGLYVHWKAESSH